MPKVPAPGPGNNSGAPAKKNPKDMTKAERREMQEKQRAAKAATAANLGGGKGVSKGQAHTQGKASGKSAPSTTPSNTPATSQQTPRRSGVGAAVAPDTPTRAAHPHTAPQRAGRDPQEDVHERRGLRIFSHFGLTRPPSSTKGDIHPAIVRLGLQFSGFKITGANARCIATLIAFKTVS